jgi:hypothetical protein
MALLFVDSFDHYTDIVSKWDAAGTDCTIRSGTGVSRTGPACLQINSAAFGPVKVVPQSTDMLVATEWYSDAPGLVVSLGNEGVGGGGIADQGSCVELYCNGNRSLSVRRGISAGHTVLGTTAPLLVNFFAYNSIAMESTVSANATVKVWCNGALVLTLVGVDTRNLHNPARNYIDTIELLGPGGIPTCYHDDVYILDCTVAPHNTYLGASRIYAVVPFENSAPLDWTPLAGTNFSEVAEIPPDDDTSYVSSGTVGQVDQYHYNTTGVPSGAQIQALQHVLDMKIDGGARSVGSDVAGVPASGVALTTTYAMYTWPYDVNPATSAPWVAGDFPLPAGPKVTA